MFPKNLLDDKATPSTPLVQPTGDDQKNSYPSFFKGCSVQEKMSCLCGPQCCPYLCTAVGGLVGTGVGGSAFAKSYGCYLGGGGGCFVSTIVSLFCYRKQLFKCCYPSGEKGEDDAVADDNAGLTNQVQCRK